MSSADESESESGDTMPFEQRKRMNKMLGERHYLLDLRSDGETHLIEFSVSGSTGNIYRLTLDTRENQLRCDCPDFSNWAARRNVLCKHACFILRRVLRQSNESALCYHSRRYLVGTMHDSIVARLETLRHRAFESICSEVVNTQYLKRYRELVHPTSVSPTANPPTDRDDMKNFGLGPRSAWSDAKSLEKLTDAECPVCFEDFKVENEMLVHCGTCFNFAHRKCLDEWLQRGSNSNCMFCRSELMYVLYKDAPQPKQRSKRKRKADESSFYANVAH